MKHWMCSPYNPLSFIFNEHNIMNRIIVSIFFVHFTFSRPVSHLIIYLDRSRGIALSNPKTCRKSTMKFTHSARGDPHNDIIIVSQWWQSTKKPRELFLFLRFYILYYIMFTTVESTITNNGYWSRYVMFFVVGKTTTSYSILCFHARDE